MAGGADPTHVFKRRIKRWRRVCQLEKHIHFLQRTAGCHFVRGKRLSTTTWTPTTSRLWKCCHYACGNIICAACCCIVTMKSPAKTGPLFCWSSTKAHWSEANMHSLGARKNCRFDHRVWTVPRCDPRARRCLADAWKVILNVWSCRPRVGKGSSQEGDMEEHLSSTPCFVPFLSWPNNLDHLLFADIGRKAILPRCARRHVISRVNFQVWRPDEPVGRVV